MFGVLSSLRTTYVSCAVANAAARQNKGEPTHVNAFHPTSRAIVAAWRIAFTACPAGCKVTGTTITIGPLRRTISFSSSVGIEGHLSSDFFNGTLNLFLNDSRVQISNTGSGGFVSGTPHDVTS